MLILVELGFLTEVEVHDMFEAFEHVIKGEYVLEKRAMLEASVEKDNIILEKFIAFK